MTIAKPAPTFLPDFLPAPGPRDHKYTRGVVALDTGSKTYPGAALLGTQAAARCGVGMVRYAGPGLVASMVVARTPEVVAAPGRAQAWVLGSGWDVSSKEGEADGIRRFTETTSLAARSSPDAFFVLDAGVLQLIDGVQEGAEFAVLTPHAGEAQELLSRCDPGTKWTRAMIEEEPRRAAARLAELTRATVVLKGHSTIIAAPETEPLAVMAPTSRLATAGTGDVLAGIIGALLAMNHGRLASAAKAGKREPVLRACAAAVELHGWSAREAALRAGAGVPCHPNIEPAGTTVVPGEGPILAHDISACIPAVIARYSRGQEQNPPR